MERTRRDPDMKALVRMLEYRRPHGSASERKFINRFIRPLGVKTDAHGNYYLKIGDNPRVLWSAHTDSVHKHSGKQRIVMTHDNIIKLRKGETACCLGADNAAGIWMLREMIMSGVPGLYVFHRQEESGGIGSSYFAEKMRHMLTGIDAAIAFDRRGTKSIITHQWVGMTASNRFATTLAELLNMDHRPDDTGSFTDTASYADIISECTNVSVGFQNEHCKTESLDVSYLIELRDAFVNINPNDLHCERTPGDSGDRWGYSRWFDSDYESRYDLGNYKGSSKSNDNHDTYEPYEPLTNGSDYARLEQLARKYPEHVADFLEMNGISAEEIEEHIWQSMGYSTHKEDAR